MGDFDSGRVPLEFCRPSFAPDLRAGRARLLGLEQGELLGKGSLGRVHIYHDASGATFVVKTVKVEDEVSRKRASVECAVVQMLNHKLFPKYLAAIEVQGELKLVMEHISGTSLHAVIGASEEGLPEATIKVIASALVTALEYLHSQGIIYVDLKPENVVILHQTRSASPEATSLNPSQPLCLIDFDLCRRKRDNVTEAGGSESVDCLSRSSGAPDQNEERLWGTIEYIAPEVIEHGMEGYSEASDWWTLGVLMYECVFRRSPFYGPNQERIFYNIQMRAPEFPRETTKVSDQCQIFIRSLLRQRREYRLGSKEGANEVRAHKFLSGA